MLDGRAGLRMGPASAWARLVHGPGVRMAESPQPLAPRETPSAWRLIRQQTRGVGRQPARSGAGNGVSRSQRQRPAALATPFEIAAQGLGLIRARHRPDQQRLPPVLDAR